MKSFASKDEVDLDERLVFHQGRWVDKQCPKLHHQACFRCRILSFLEATIKFIFWCMICVAVGLWLSTLTNDGENEHFIKNCQTITSTHFVPNGTAYYWLRFFLTSFSIKWYNKSTMNWIFSIQMINESFWFSYLELGSNWTNIRDDEAWNGWNKK